MTQAAQDPAPEADPLTREHIRPRLLGHRGTGPGHGGPAPIAARRLEGTCTETYPAVTQDEPAEVRDWAVSGRAGKG